MTRRSRGTGLDISIRGDEQEHNRIQLEHNLQNTELSFHLSSASDDERGVQHRQRHRQHDSSVEYPRHTSEPSVFPEFPSFVHRSRDQFGEEEMQSHMHGWSYRTGDDDEGINPYGGESLSTVAHHASVVTIGAGLGGSRGARRDPSLSGAEYDPDRPLHAMIAGVNSKHTMLDMDSKFQSMTVEPLVVDNTAELDRILDSGHTAPPSMRSRSVRLISPLSSASSSSSDTERGQAKAQSTSRPKLTDHLSSANFSPKRPRSRQSNITNVAPGSPVCRRHRAVEEDNISVNMPTPRPAHRNNGFAAQATVTPEVRLHPATPSSAASKFPRISRAEAAKSSLTDSHSTRPASAPPERNPFHDVSHHAEKSSAASPYGRRPSGRSFRKDSSKGRVYLPDVTGITNAVESPAKVGLEYLPYRADNRPRDSEARLLQTLSAVQNQLRDLEEENGISRRRVRELEMELEECKREVARERTKLIEREELSYGGLQNEPSRQRDGRGKAKGKAKAGPAEIDDDRVHERYKEAVEEKKALESLINSLRSHLSRLTAELASHKELLTELRHLRDADARALRDKSAEITQLREEVQRLAGEVEVLRGVVEEGLKERRSSRENIQVEQSVADIAMSQDLEEEEEDEEEAEQEVEQDEEESSEDEDETQDAEPFDPASINEEAARPSPADRTMRTDFATLGSSQFGQSTGTRFVDDEELERITAEVEERRSNMSMTSQPQQQRVQSPSLRLNRRATVEDVEDDDDNDTMQPIPTRMHEAPVVRQPEPSTSRPSGPAAGYYEKFNIDTEDEERVEVQEPETPFPQIRGEHLERLFFSAPEHNARTCTVCYRRRNRPSNAGSPSWSNPNNVRKPKVPDAMQNHGEVEDEEDEGFGEGSENAAETDKAVRDKGKQRENVTFSKDPNHWRQAGRDRGLPPQTVVARVIRELEDDFTHYKSVYVELADQYKVMDAVSDVRRRNMLANHLREVVDILEQKGDQIAALYDLLSFKDKPLNDSVFVPNKGRPTSQAARWGRPN